MGGGARERPRLVLPRPPPPGRGSRHRGGRSAAAAARGSAVQSSARGAAGAAASATGKLKGKGDDRVTRPPAGAPRPRSRPRACLGPPPRPGRGCRPSAPALCAHAGARRRPGPARPGALATLARPSSPPSLAPWPPPAAPPVPHSSPPAASKAPSSLPGPGPAPPGDARARGRAPAPSREEAGAGRSGWGLLPDPAPPGLLPRDPPQPLPPIFFFPGKLSRARPGGRRGRGVPPSFLLHTGRSRSFHPHPALRP